MVALFFNSINSIVFDKTETLTTTKIMKIEFVPEPNSALSDYKLQLVKSLVYYSAHRSAERKIIKASFGIFLA